MTELHDEVAAELTSSVAMIFENGWQPKEVAHVVRRGLSTAAAQLLSIVVSDHARRWSAVDDAPVEWSAQIDSAADGSRSSIRQWRRSGAVPPHAVWTAQLSLLGLLGSLRPIKPLITVPSGWSTSTQRSGSHRSDAAARPADEKVLAKIRGLLAKAESTSFAAEAEALSAKAQDLMTRHAIDTAMVESANTVASEMLVITRRILVDSPYSETKASLLHAVARPNGVRAVSLDSYGIVTVIGMPVDLDFCELLFTSLLVQASRAMRDSGEPTTGRTTSYRRSFLYAFADGIGARLARARDEAAREASNRYGSALVPVLTARAEAVDTAFREQFPQTTRTSRSVSNRAGWVAGRVAAERADLSVGAGRIARSTPLVAR